MTIGRTILRMSAAPVVDGWTTYGVTSIDGRFRFINILRPE